MARRWVSSNSRAFWIATPTLAAIQNARLYQETGRRASEMAALADLGREVGGLLEQLAGPVGGSLEDRVEVEHAAHFAPELREGGHLVRPTLGLPVEPGICDGDPDVRSDRGQQSRLALAEPARLLRALDADRPDRAALHCLIGTPRYESAGVPTAWTPTSSRSPAARFNRRGRRFHRCPRGQSLAVPQGRGGALLGPVLEVVRKLDDAGRLCVQGDVDDVGAEQVAELVAQPVHRALGGLRRPRAGATGLTIASSPARWPVSWNRRAFSSATERLPAIVTEQADVGLAERVFPIEVVK